MSIYDIESKIELESILNKESITFLLFQTSWCLVCKEIVDSLITKIQPYENSVRFYTMDYTIDQTVLVEYGIIGYPTMLFFKGNVVKKKIVGECMTDEIISEIEKLIS